MLTLVYISTARETISRATCEHILAASRVNNQVDGITGLLIAGQKRFLQALEGPADAVRQTYARIAADPRHYACVLVGERTSDTPQFGNWAMGYRAGHDAADDASLRAQFTGFAALQSRAA